MKTKRVTRRVSAPDNDGAAKENQGRRRSPAFGLSPAQVIQRCKKRNEPVILAGVILALRDTMTTQGLSMLELSEISHISRPAISELLNIKTSPSFTTIWILAFAMGHDLQSLAILVRLELILEVSP